MEQKRKSITTERTSEIFRIGFTELRDRSSKAIFSFVNWNKANKMRPLPTLFCVLEVLILFGHSKISTSKMFHNVQKKHDGGSISDVTCGLQKVWEPQVKSLLFFKWLLQSSSIQLICWFLHKDPPTHTHTRADPDFYPIATGPWVFCNFVLKGIYIFCRCMLLTQGQSLSKAFPTTDKARMFSFTPEIAQGLPVRMDIIENIN